MPIFVTVQPDSATYAECLIYATGTPMLAIHDPSASVMVTIGQDSGSALRSAQFAAQLVSRWPAVRARGAAVRWFDGYHRCWLAEHGAAGYGGSGKFVAA